MYSNCDLDNIYFSFVIVWLLYVYVLFVCVCLLCARVFTVFSTSKDHRQGERAMAGCILVDSDQIQVG